VEDPAQAQRRLAGGLADPSERMRARAARAAAGLAAREPKLAAKLLEPALADPAHDVRAAALGSLAVAWAGMKSPAELAKVLAGAERNALTRLAAAGALLVHARGADGRAAVEAALKPIADKGPPFAELTADLLLGLLAADADGHAFLAQLVP
jgi:hypothetical protein